MPTPVERITVHHRGGGPPANGTWPDSDPYCALIGPSALTIVQAPFTAWATYGFNHVSFDICFSGDRMTYPVTDNDLHLISEACGTARSRGWLAAVATTFPHGTLHPPPPGYPTGSSATDCPGTLAIARWPEIVAACGAAPAPSPGDDDVPANSDIVDAYSGPDGSWKLQYDGGVQTIRGQFYGSYFSLPASDRNDPNRRFLTICAPVNGATVGYSIVSLKGEAYTFKPK
jgi:hypothetical protein